MQANYFAIRPITGRLKPGSHVCVYFVEHWITTSSLSITVWCSGKDRSWTFRHLIKITQQQQFAGIAMSTRDFIHRAYKTKLRGKTAWQCLAWRSPSLVLQTPNCWYAKIFVTMSTGVGWDNKFYVQIAKFSLPWQQGRSGANLNDIMKLAVLENPVWYETSCNDTIKLADPENPLWYQNLGIISYGNRITANMAVREPQCGVWWKRFSLIVNPAPCIIWV